MRLFDAVFFGLSTFHFMIHFTFRLMIHFTFRFKVRFTFHAVFLGLSAIHFTFIP